MLRLRPSPQPMIDPVITLYGGEGCHLCHQARDLILPLLPPGWRLREVDVRADAELQARYGLRIPVMAVGEREKGWPFTAGQVRRLLEG
ncbi:MAG TPA: glutaredoxin family protein, partial [Porticoccaceae bacterium]|nr:glutaredoxin family protein [Porticoccaceae bacterium]